MKDSDPRLATIGQALERLGQKLKVIANLERINAVDKSPYDRMISEVQSEKQSEDELLLVQKFIRTKIAEVYRDFLERQRLYIASTLLSRQRGRKVGGGNCGEIAAFLFWWLYKHGCRPITYLSTTFGEMQDIGFTNHAFVAVGCPEEQAKENEISLYSWDEDSSVVVDPWMAKYCELRGMKARLPLYSAEEYADLLRRVGLSYKNLSVCLHLD
ncbi:MAG: hypothetical protein OHK0024_08900 [Thalassobaculales bacterium]